MNKIVRNYPVDQLPPDLRDGLPEHGWVKIELVPEIEPQRRVLLAELAGTGTNIHGNDEEVVQYIRSLRGGL